MAVAFDAKCTTVSYFNSSPPGDFATLTVGSGSNRVLVVGITFDLTALPAGLAVTWDQGGTNQAMTQITGAFADQTGGSGTPSCSVLFGLVAPTSGARTLRVNWTSGTHNVYCMAISFTGADQTGGNTTFPNGTGNSNSGTANSPSTVTITSSVNNAIVAMHVENNLASSTARSDQDIGENHAGITDSGANYAVGIGTHALTCTWSINCNWAVSGTDILAASVVAATATMMPMISM